MAMPAATTASPAAVATNGEDEDLINIQIMVPELQIQKCLCVYLDEIVWDVKRKLLAALPQPLPQAFNFGLFLPPCDGRAGKFLLEDRPIRDYPFHDCVPYLELKYKKRVYKMLKLDEKQLKQLHSKSTMKKFVEYIQARNADKVEKLSQQGLDANFHDADGETPLTIAAGVSDNRNVIIQLVGGGAHIDFRNSEGQTGMHKAAFLSMTDNVKTMLELGGSPNYRDQIGLTPLYYNMLMADANDTVAEMLLAEAAELGVTDMHGNHELHQACKNGLMKHVEHLLYYGADINAQNVNGNTPLHVCSVNNRPECARVLLFRGADPNVPNNQGQTALHVAHIVGSTGVAEVIQKHNPNAAVPYRGVPKYNTKRRLNNTISRRRSLSQSSLASSQSDYYRTPQPVRCANFVAPSPSPSRATVIGNGSEYGTMRRYAADSVKPAAPGSDLNIPRILVIPRGPKGFGFILRGAKRAETDMEFEPTPVVPALQFFEGVDMLGMAMRAGLRPGDFLLEINGYDVRKASHEQVVQLIQQAEDTITLKVITIDPHAAVPQHPHQNHYAGTLPSRRNHSVPRNGLPPVPPQRHPGTSLTYARGGAIQNMMFSYSDEKRVDPSYYQTTAAAAANRSSTTSSVLMHHYPAKSVESLMPSGADLYGATGDYAAWARHAQDPSSSMSHFRCASVKSRPTAQRRISAAELEHLMVRQRAATTSSSPTASSSQFHPQNLYGQDPMSSQTPRKFTSVADMKRKKNRGVPSPSLSGTGLPRMSYEQDPYQQPSTLTRDQANMLKSFNSSPDLQARAIFESNSNDTVPTPPPMPDVTRRQSSDDVRLDEYSEYSRPFRPALRPKTPPPPPPGSNSDVYARSTMNRQAGRHPVPPPQPDPDYSDGTDQEQEVSRSPEAVKRQVQQQYAPPPPPPPPPAPATTVNCAPPPPPPPPPPPDMLKTKTAITKTRTAASGAVADVRGISAEALTSVTLKPTATNASIGSAGAGGKAKLDFDSDLRNALAKRRSKVAIDDNDDISEGRKTAEAESKPGITTLTKYGGLSLRESVRENVQNTTKPVPKSQHSPPGFGCKKDSGYTSSRTSLEPSECGDEPSGATLVRVHDPSGNLTPTANDYRVSLLSQQLEDNYGTSSLLQQRKTAQQDTMSVSSSGCSESSTVADRPLLVEDPSRTPAADYDDPDSAKAPTNGGQFSGKDLAAWNMADVADWLRSLDLAGYETNFYRQRICGSELLRFDRARYTQLGVTRIAHRQAMEQSLKSFAPSN